MRAQQGVRDITHATATQILELRAERPKGAAVIGLLLGCLKSYSVPPRRRPSKGRVYKYDMTLEALRFLYPARRGPLEKPLAPVRNLIVRTDQRAQVSHVVNLVDWHVSVDNLDIAHLFVSERFGLRGNGDLFRGSPASPTPFTKRGGPWPGAQPYSERRRKCLRGAVHRHP